MMNLLSLIGSSILIVLLFSIVFIILQGNYPKKWTLLIFPMILAILGGGYLVLVSPSPFAVSDSVEYVALARRIFYEGSPYLEFHHEKIPSRYPIWFSLIFVQPFLAFPSIDLALTISSVLWGTLLILGSLLTFWYIEKTPSFFSGVLLTSILILLPEVRYFSGIPLTDIPTAALWSITFYGFLLLNEKKTKPLLWAVGFIIGVAVAIRPTNVFLFIPALFFFRSLRLILPGLFFIIITLFFNYSFFGSPLRTGYQFWLPMPYDNPSLTWNFSYFLRNLEGLSKSSFALVLPLFFVLSFQHIRNNFLARVSLIALLPLIITYLTYFYFTPRFFLPAISTTLVLIILPIKSRSLITSLTAVFLISLFFLIRSSHEENELTKLRKLSECLPDSGYVVSTLNPLLIEEFVIHDKNVKFIPYSREQEYASKEPGKDIYPEVFKDKEVDIIKRGQHVYYDKSFELSSELKELKFPKCDEWRQVLLEANSLTY